MFSALGPTAGLQCGLQDFSESLTGPIRLPRREPSLTFVTQKNVQPGTGAPGAAFSNDELFMRFPRGVGVDVPDEIACSAAMLVAAYEGREARTVAPAAAAPATKNFLRPNSPAMSAG